MKQKTNHFLATIQKILSILKYPLWVAASYYIARYIVTIINTIFQDFLSSNTYKIIISFVFYIIFFLIFFLISRKIFKEKPLNRAELGLKSTPTWTDILLSIIGFVAYVALSFVLTKIFEIFPSFDPNQEQEIMYKFLSPGAERIFAYLTMAVIPPIVEEVVFRGWLYFNLKNKLSGKKSKILSILIVSTLFGIMHGQWNVGIGVFTMSVVACLIRELTGTIYGSILLHIIANSLAFYLLFVLYI